MKESDMVSISQASTPFHFRNMEEGSSSSSSSSSSYIQPGSSPAIDRYNPIILDPTRLRTCSSPPLLSPTPPPPLPKINNNKLNKKKQKTTDYANISTSSSRRSWSCMNMNKAEGFISPPVSSRYLLSEKAYLNVVSDFDPVLNLVPPEPSKTHPITKHESIPAPPTSDQVVVLRVSLHCRGCERKMKKHLSRMEGVSSFNIDFAAKMVTVVGKVTPLEVLANILKVKNAQLWTPPIPQTMFDVKKP